MVKEVKIPDELKKKFEQLKLKLDKFKKKVLKEFNEYVVGIALLPPKEDNKEAINVLVLVDDTDSKKMSKFELRDKLTKIIAKFAEEVEKYIMSYVAAGSLFRGDKKAHDIDVFIIVDDTDVKRMSRYELKERLRYIIIEQGYQAKELTGVNKDFHVQTYILTDFWDSVKDANPVIFTFLRDGVPLFDRGVFMPWRLLLQMGRIKPSPEAIDM